MISEAKRQESPLKEDFSKRFKLKKLISDRDLFSIFERNIN